MAKLTIGLVALASMLAPVQLQAHAPLCRDLKGLFTPCPPGTVSAATKRNHHSGKAVASGTASEASEPSDNGSGRPARSADASDAQTPDKQQPAELAARHRPPLFATGHLCRDTKGLFTPCPK